MATEMVLSVALSALVGGIGGYVLRFYLATRDAECKRAFEEGVAKGRAEEQARLEVRVAPVRYDEESWFGAKHTLVVGYSQQIFYNGLPVGAPQEVVTHFEETWNEDRVNEVFKLANKAAGAYVKALAAGGVRAALQR